MADIFTIISGIFLVGFGYGIYQIAKRENKPDNVVVPDDAREIGALWNTIPPQLKITKVKLKIEAVEEVEEKTFSLPDYESKSTKLISERMALRQKIVEHDQVMTNLESELSTTLLRRKEVLAIIRSIHTHQVRLELPTDESLQFGLDVLEGSELENRMAELSEMLNDLKENLLGKEKEIVEEDREELDIKSKEKFVSTLDEELQDLKTRLEDRQDIEAIRISICNARSVEEIDAIEVDIASETASKSLAGLKDERRKIIVTEEKYNTLSHEIPLINDLEELIRLNFSPFTPVMIEKLQTLSNKRKYELIVKDIAEVERDAFEKIDKEMMDVSSLEGLDAIVISSVNTNQERILEVIRDKRRGDLQYGIVMGSIDFAESALQIDAIEIPDLSEGRMHKINTKMQEKRQALVEELRLKKQAKKFNKYCGIIETCEDMEELLTKNFYNVGVQQFEELENRRAQRLIHLQNQTYNNNKLTIENAVELKDLEHIPLRNLRDEQIEEFLELIEEKSDEIELGVILTEGIGIALQTQPDNAIEFDSGFEEETLQRLMGYEGQYSDVMFTLLWNDKNDLDVIIRCPDSSLIYKGKNSNSGGRIDIEMNAESPISDPLENIIWDSQDTPGGQYDVFVWFKENRSLIGAKSALKVRVQDGPLISAFSCTLEESTRVLWVASVSISDPVARGEMIARERDNRATLWHQLATAENPESLPELNGMLLSPMNIEEFAAERENRVEYLTELVERIRLEKEDEAMDIVIAAINDAQNAEQLDQIEFTGVAPEQIPKVEKRLEKQRASLEKFAERTRKDTMRTNYKLLANSIANAQVSDDLRELPQLELFDKDAEKIKSAFEKKLTEVRKNEQQELERENVRRIKSTIESLSTFEDAISMEISGVNDNDGTQLLRLLEIKAEELRIQKEETERFERRSANLSQILEASIAASQSTFIEGCERNDEFVKRMNKENASVGPLTFTLLWDNLNDLDLLIRTPSGEIIHHGNRQSSDGGNLELDMNAKGRTKRPIENVLWMQSAPSGSYHVFVHHHSKHGRLFDSDPTTYMVRISSKDDIYSSEGRISNGEPVKHIGCFIIAQR